VTGSNRLFELSPQPCSNNDAVKHAAYDTAAWLPGIGSRWFIFKLGLQGSASTRLGVNKHPERGPWPDVLVMHGQLMVGLPSLPYSTYRLQIEG